MVGAVNARRMSDEVKSIREARAVVVTAANKE